MKAQRQLGLPKHSPAFLCHFFIRVYPAHPWFKIVFFSLACGPKNDSARKRVERRASRVQSLNRLPSRHAGAAWRAGGQPIISLCFNYSVNNDFARNFSIHVSFAPREGILDDTPDGADAVFPIDLLALGVGAPVVGDSDFVEADTLLGELGGDFRLKTETVFLDGDGLQNFPPHGLVACLHIRKIEIGEHIGHEREEAIAHGVPEVEHPVFL